MPLLQFLMNKESILLDTQAKKLTEIWYQPESDKLWMADGRARFVGYRKAAVTTRLEHEYKLSASEAKALYADVYRDNVVDLVTPIGGWSKGVHNIGGNKVLVPTEQRRIEPIKGDWEVIRSFIQFDKVRNH